MRSNRARGGSKAAIQQGFALKPPPALRATPLTQEGSRAYNYSVLLQHDPESVYRAGPISLAADGASGFAAG